jgi:protein ImuB
MFACLYLPPLVNRAASAFAPGGATADRQGSRLRQGSGGQARLRAQEIVQLARDFSPRVETHGDGLVTLDVSGLGSLLGDARAIGEELRRTAADRGLRVHVAIAATATAAILLAQSRAGLVVIPPGEEAQALAPLPLSVLEAYAAFVAPGASAFAAPASVAASADKPLAPDFHRWGLRTLGDLAALPAADLSERLGQHGLAWQRWARGQDARPLVPAGVEEGFEEALDLEWPIEGLEPLSFVLARLFDPLCERLEQRDRGAVVLHVTLTLVTKERHERSLQLPAPMRDARVLRTLALLDLESHPPPAAIDRVRVGVDVTEGRVLQFGLFARALPTERLATLMARLGALMGSERVGAPALVDSHRPGAFAMGTFEPKAAQRASDSRLRTPGSRLQAPDSRLQAQSPKPEARSPESGACAILRRFRSPIPARVTLEQGRPVRVTTDRRGFTGGAVERCDGPWRSSGDWWLAPAFAAQSGATARQARAAWNCDEWDVTLTDGASYRISRCDIAEREVAARRAGASRDSLKDAWFVDGILD